MTAITWSDVTSHVPSVSTTGVQLRNDILEYVNTRVRVDDFGGETAISAKLARVYLAAHFATYNAQAASGQSGAVQSESVGGISRSYSTPSFDLGTTGQTVWGQIYSSLVMSSAARVPLVL